MAKKAAPAKPGREELCPHCGRLVRLVEDGRRCTHGPGPEGTLICPGSGDEGMVKAGDFKVD